MHTGMLIESDGNFFEETYLSFRMRMIIRPSLRMRMTAPTLRALILKPM